MVAVHRGRSASLKPVTGRRTASLIAAAACRPDPRPLPLRGPSARHAELYLRRGSLPRSMCPTCGAICLHDQRGDRGHPPPGPVPPRVGGQPPFRGPAPVGSRLAGVPAAVEPNAVRRVADAQSRRFRLAPLGDPGPMPGFRDCARRPCNSWERESGTGRRQNPGSSTGPTRSRPRTALQQGWRMSLPAAVLGS